MPKRTVVASPAVTGGLWRHERLAIAVAVPEITLQADKYFMYHPDDAALGAVGGLNVSPTLLCLIYLYAAWFIDASYSRFASNKTIVWGLPNLVYLLTIAMSILAAAVPMLAIFDLFLVVQAYLLFFYFANRIHRFDDLIFSILVLAGTMALQGIICIGLWLMGNAAVGQEFLYGPVSLVVMEQGRVAGTLSSAVLCGSLLAMIFLPVLALNFTTQDRKVRLITGLAVILGAAAIFVTQTRGAIISVFLGSVLIGFGLSIRGWLPKWVVQAAMIGLVLASVPVAYVVQKRVLGDDEGSAESRKHLSLIAIDTIKKSPIFGHGAGNCHLACADAANGGSFRAEWYFTVHCKYLLVWVETGIIGLAAFLLMMANGIRYGFVAWLQRRQSLSPIGLAMCAALIGHMLHMVVDIFNSRAQVQMLWVVMGLTAAIYRLSQQVRLEDTKSIREGGYVA